MQKKNLLYIIFIFLTFISCSKNKNDIVIIKEDDTLKKSINIKESQIYWTDPIDAEILTQNYSFPEILGNYTSLNINFVNSIVDAFNPCLPIINNIGSLDNSDISSEIRIFVNQICNAIKKNPEIELGKYFDENYLFNKSFFISDLRDIWNIKFNEKYPEKNLFDKYYIGRINENFDLTETTIRFYKNKNFIDITLFISQNEKKINLKQIEINNQE